jgi:hypothetical protein
VAKVKLEAELIDKVTGKASKIAREQERMMRTAAKAEAKQRAAGEREYAKAQKIFRQGQAVKQRTEAKATALAERESKALQKIAARDQARRDKMRRQDLINHARGIAKRDRLEQRSAAKLAAERARNLARHEQKHGTLSGFGASFAGNLAANAAGGALQLAGALGKAAMGYVTMGSKAKFAFNAVAGSETKGASALAHAGELAVRFGLDLGETQSLYRDLMDLELDRKNIDTFIRLGASMRATGESAETVDGVLRSLGDVKVKGVLDSRGLRSLGKGAGVQRTHLLKALGEELGLGKDANEDQLAEALGKKGLKADKAIPLIQKALMAGVGESRPGEVGEKYADQTLDGLTGRIKARAEIVAQKSLSKLEAPLMKMASKMEAWVESGDAEKFLDKLVKGFTELEPKISKFVDDIGGIAGTISTTVTLIQAAISPVINMFEPFVSAFTMINQILEDQNKSLFTKMYEIGGQAILGLIKGVFSVTTLGLGPAMWDVGKTMLGSVSKSLGIASPSREMARLGVYAGQGLIVGTESTYSGVSGAGYGLGSSLSGGAAKGVTLSAVPQASAGASVLGGSAGAVQVNVTVEAGASDEETGKIVGRAVRRELETLMRQARNEVGA